MPGEYPVLVLKSENDKNSLEIEYISNESIPESLNGESGFHVCHVRMLAQLMLEELARSVPSLSEKDIQAISVASSLHDIGKMRVPKSILDFPGKLSPVEYDIVKKHAIFGEEIIDGIDSGIDPLIIKYAKEIARHHHERYDGNGYPDGLAGNDIPISAQVVSLSDAFDALTSSRSYKQAFSQDVAIEMIANGMCGVFSSELIECLLSVVNNKKLIELRENIKKARSVINEQNLFVPKSVLIIGNTGYVDNKFIEETFPVSKVMVIDGINALPSDNIKIYKLGDESVKKIFETYDFDLIVYFSSELTYGYEGKSDAHKLREVLKYASEYEKGCKFIYLSSLDGAFENKDDRAVLSTSKERLCEYYGDKRSIEVKIIRIPFLYGGTVKNDFLNGIFEKIHDGIGIILDESAAARCYFLSMIDLSDLIVRLTDNWTEGTGILTVNDEFGLTFLDITEKVRRTDSSASFDFSGEAPAYELNTNNLAIKNEYGWFSKVSIVEEIEEQYEKYLLSLGEKKESLWDRIKAWLNKHSLIFKIIELLAVFIINELLIHLTKSAIYFSIVDFRTIFVVVMATIHGLRFGMAAAGLSSLSWLVSKLLSGTSFLTIFYEPTNWLAFVFYFLVGGICGYVKIKSDDTIKYAKSEINLLEEKLAFTRDIYNDTYRDKRDLKKQIIGSKDSFGKIFDVTRNLDTVEPRRLYLKIMDTFEDVLENKSISVYSINAGSAFGRLEVASRDIINEAAKSISLDAYSPVIKAIESGEIWRNTGLTPGLPMYAAGVYRAGELVLVIFIWHTKIEQRTLYYVNLFRILRDLVEISLLRAYDYNQAMHEKEYLPGTSILNTEAMERIYTSFKDMAERKVFSYMVLEVDGKGKDYTELNRVISRRIRVNDIMGLREDGKLWLLMSQATDADLDFILPRFKDLDIEITVLNK